MITRSMGYRGMGHMVNGVQGMGHMGNGVQGYGAHVWAMRYRGMGAHRAMGYRVQGYGAHV